MKKMGIVFVLSLLISTTVFMLSCINPVDSDDNDAKNDIEDYEEYQIAWEALNSYFIFRDSLPNAPYSYSTPQELYASVREPYTNYYTSEQRELIMEYISSQTTGMGIWYDTVDIGAVIKRVIPSSPADDAGLLTGDTIITIDSISVQNKGVDEIESMIEGNPLEERTMGIKRDSSLMNITVTLDIYLGPSVVSDSLDSSTAYIALLEFSDSTFHEEGSYGEMREVLTEFSWAENTILDLRSNTGGYLDQGIDIISLFVESGTPIAKLYERRFSEEDTSFNTVDTTYYTVNNGEPFDCNLYILVNDTTASASELLVSCLMEQRADNTTVIGTTTYGKGCGQVVITDPLKGMVTVTSMLINPLNTVSYHEHGITPDITISYGEDAKDVAISEINQDVVSKCLISREVDSPFYKQVKKYRTSLNRRIKLPLQFIIKSDIMKTYGDL